ncbi:MAG TPA: hypothetical protein VEL74_04910 [Thermoanaerobaculia bacterium]|nr:hypothetical protein [Thermoanaerobaculia bacterium]
MSTDNEGKTTRLDRFRSWLRLLVALGLWAAFARFLAGLSPLPAPTPFLTVAAVLLTLALSLVAFNSLLHFIAYMVTFPVWAPIYLIGSVVARLRVPVIGLGARLGRFYRSPLAAFLHIPVAILLEVVIYDSNKPAYLTVSLGVLLFVTFDMILITFFISPSILVARRILRIARRYIEQGNMEEAVFDRKFRAWPDSAASTKARNQLEFFMTAEGWLRRSGDTLLSLRSVVTSFLILLLGTFFFVAMSFGFIFLAGWKLDPAFFGCTAATPGVVDSAFFSLTTITTAGGSVLCPGTVLAKSLVAIELFCGLLLLSFAGIGFSTLHATDVEGTRTEFAALRREALERMVQVAKTLHLAVRLAQEKRLPDDEAARSEARSSGRTQVEVWSEWVAQAAKDLPNLPDESSAATAEFERWLAEEAGQRP